MKKPWDILNEDPSGLKFRDNTRELWPEPSTIFRTLPFSRTRNGLAREPAADEVDGFEVVCPAVSDISKSGNAGPVFFKDLRAVVIYLHLPGASHSRALQPQVDPADARKEAAESQVSSSIR